MSTGHREKIGKAVVETLEDRRLLSTVSFHQGVLTVSGYSGAPNELSIHLSQDGRSLWGVANAETGDAVSVEEVKQIRIYGGELDDQVKVDPRINIPVYIQTGDGDDFIVAGGGNDTIIAGNGRDTIDAGDGDDVVYGGNGNDLIYGGAGNDFIDGGNGSDVIHGGVGHDTLHGSSGDDTINGEGGDDIIDTGIGRSSASGGAGNDTVIGTRQDTLVGGINGNNVIISRATLALINAETNEAIPGYEGLVDGVKLNLATLPTNKLNIRADFGEEFGGSVVFELNGQVISTENSAPYAMASDSNGNYHAWTPEVGEYSLVATTYSESNARGELIETLNLNFKVVNEQPPAGDEQIAVPTPSSFTLINAETNQPIAGFENLKNGDVIDLAKLPTSKLNIRANLPENFDGSVVFGYNGNEKHSVENLAPWAFNHDNHGNYYAWTPALGSHTVSATAYAEKNLGGAASQTLTVQFNVIKSASSNPAPTPTPTPAPSPTPPPTTSGPGTYPGSTPGDVSSTGAAGTATISAITRSTQQGHAIHVHALNSKLNSGTVLTNTFEWDFGDKGSKYNTLRGWNAAHVYNKPGTYTITLTITNPAGKQTVTRMNVTVNASSRKVIYVSRSGSDTNTGLSQNQAVRTFAKAMSMVTDNTEILFRRGDKFDFDAGIRTKASNVVIGAYGMGDRPVLNYTGPRTRTTFIYVDKGARDFTIRDLTFDTIFNKDTGQKDMPFAVSPAGSNITVTGCQFLNLGYAMNLNGKPTGMLSQDNVAPLKTGLRDYFMWTEGSDVVILGNTVANSTREHIVRMTRIERVNVQYNDFTNLDLRDSTADKYDTAKGTIVTQKGKYGYIANNSVKGPWGVGPLGQGDGLRDKEGRFEWAVVERNQFGTAPLFVQHGAEHVMVRDNVSKRSGGVAFHIDGYASDYGRGVVDVTFLNNTVINTGTSGSFIKLGGSAQQLRVVGNLYVAPNLQIGAGASAGIYVTDTNLSSFVQIDRNVWPSAANANSWANGGVNYIGKSYTSSGHVDPGTWNALSVVGDDVFRNVALSNNTYSVTISGNVIGATLRLAA
jgi:flagellar motor switch/type III secretory pathway protein FliN